MPLHLLLVLERLFNRHLIRNIHSLPYSFPRHHPLLPLLQMGKLVDVDPRPARKRDPPDGRAVRDGNVVSNDISGFRGREMGVEHAVQTPGLVDVPVHAVLDLLRRVADKVVGLALHGP